MRYNLPHLKKQKRPESQYLFRVLKNLTTWTKFWNCVAMPEVTVMLAALWSWRTLMTFTSNFNLNRS